eukprot:UN07732
MYNGDELEAEKALGFYGIRSDTRVRIATRTAIPHVNISFAFLDGKRIHLDCPVTSLVGDLKAHLEREEGIPPHLQHFMFFGEDLSDCSDLVTYKIKHGDVIHVKIESPTYGQIKPTPPPLTLPKARPGSFKFNITD